MMLRLSCVKQVETSVLIAEWRRGSDMFAG